MHDLLLYYTWKMCNKDTVIAVLIKLFISKLVFFVRKLNVNYLYCGRKCESLKQNWNIHFSNTVAYFIHVYY